MQRVYKRELKLGKCHAYLVSIGIPWMTANEIIGRYSLDAIREAVLTLKHNRVNVAHREKYLLSTLEGREHLLC